MKKFAERFGLIAVGLSMFSMFFGSGNVVFPLVVGQVAQDQTFFALLGLLATAVFVPFIGLLGMILYDGDYRAFFARLGNFSGFAVIVLIMGLIGPFGIIPRCIALSYSTWQMLFPGTNLLVFSALSLIVIYICTIQKNRIIEILGGVLTPILLVALGFIIVLGLTHPEVPVSGISDTSAFCVGLLAGYQIMDLLGSFFFCSVVIGALKQISHENSLVKNSIYASAIGASLLGLVYGGLALVTGWHSSIVSDVPQDMLLAKIALYVLGPYAGVTTCIVVILACLTTAIALTAVFTEFVHFDVCKDVVSYKTSLVVSLCIAFFFSTLNFQGIVRFLTPIVQLIYPGLLVLSGCNIAYKLYGFRYVKMPVLAAVIISAIIHFYSW